MKSRVITISAVSAALTAIFLILGTYVEVIDIFAIITSSVFIILPLYYKSYKGSILASVVGGVIALCCCIPKLLTPVFPAYFAFFGIYPIIACLMRDKGVNKFLRFFIGLIWCVAVFYGGYYFCVGVLGFTLSDLPKVIIDYALIFVGLIGIVFFVIYDRFIYLLKKFVDYYLNRIIK